MFDIPFSFKFQDFKEHVNSMGMSARIFRLNSVEKVQ